jgi:ribonucleoside-triphosphate reductase
MEKIPCETYSRCCGYFRPVAQWNKGKKEEFKDRVVYKINLSEEKNDVGVI